MIYYNRENEIIDIVGEKEEVAVEIMELLAAFGVKIWEEGYKPELISKQIYESAKKIVEKYEDVKLKEALQSVLEEEAPIVDNKEGLSF